MVEPLPHSHATRGLLGTAGSRWGRVTTGAHPREPWRLGFLSYRPIAEPVDKRVLWMCIAVGSTVGGLIPQAWNASGFGVAALLGSAIGGIVGVWVAVRISGSL